MSNTNPITTISSTTVQTHFGDLLRRAYKHKERFIVERGGLPVVVILPVAEYEALTKAQEQLTHLANS